MSPGVIVVEAAGPLTTVQDGGRRGWKKFGVPTSGPVDRLAFAAARVMTGGTTDAAAIELSIGGMTVRCEAGPIGFALCGPGFTATVDGVQFGGWVAGTLDVGARLHIRSGAGNWGYLAFSGDIKASRWLGSAATHTASGLGGGSIVAGARFEIAGACPIDRQSWTAPDDIAPISAARAVLGPQERFFDDATLDRFRTGHFIASARFNRMGLMLDGPELPPQRLDMLSEPMTRGNLQIDGAGRATLLLADHQTTGGYPKIATFLERDAERIAQLPADHSFTVELIPPELAVSVARDQARRRDDYLMKLSCPETLGSRLMRHNLITAFAEDLD